MSKAEHTLSAVPNASLLPGYATHHGVPLTENQIHYALEHEHLCIKHKKNITTYMMLLLLDAVCSAIIQEGRYQLWKR